MRLLRSSFRLFGALGIIACAPSASTRDAGSRDADARSAEGALLPTGRRLDPAGTTSDIGAMALAMVPSPEGDRAVLLLDGYREQGVQVVDRATGRVVQTLLQPAAFVGLAFSPDGRTLYASGGNQDVIYRYSWRDRQAVLVDSLVLERKRAGKSGRSYPAGLAPSPDGRLLYVAENLYDSLAVIDVGSGRVVQRVATGRYPYGVVVAADGRVFVSAWGASAVNLFAPGESAMLHEVGQIAVGRHPSALLLDADGSRLFVASASTDRVSVVDTRARRVVATITDAPPARAGAELLGEGSTPNALSLSPDGRRLFVAEADNNAVALFDRTAPDEWTLAGRVPTGWYPTSLLSSGDTLLVAAGKGRGAGPNKLNGPQPDVGRREPSGYTLGQLRGTVHVVSGMMAPAAALAPLDVRVARANRWGEPRSAPSYPPFEHVIYIIKENRTYDQLLGDLSSGDGDTSLVFFPRAVAPNHHALAERFGLFDRFFVNAEVSPDGHNWSMAAYATDYLEKTVPSHYSSRGRTYDYEGTNRGDAPPDGDDAAAPAAGYLWDLAVRKGITFRNYGEFVGHLPRTAEEATAEYAGSKPALVPVTSPKYPGFDLTIRDQHRADVWIAELREFERAGAMPTLEILRLPNDHTSGGTADAPTPRAFVADNDLALGRMVEALSRSRFWSSTVMFVLEDDAQNGPDHVDSHRSPLFVISAYNRPGTIHRFANTTDVLATIEELLGLGNLSQFDHYGRPLREVFAPQADLTPYSTLVSTVSLDEKNPKRNRNATESSKLDFRVEDRADDAQFNVLLWRMIKGEHTPYPGTTNDPRVAMESRR